MRTHAITALLAVSLFTLSGCAEAVTTEPRADDKPVSSPSTAGRQADRDAVRAAAGLPPEPKGSQRQAFLDGLDAIDKDIVHAKDDKAISRGIDTCGMIKDHPKDPVKQTEQTNKRWTSPSHPDGHGLTKAARILAVTHTIICPTY
ncbi:hypothetical protein [Streptomyces sp. NPDC002602]|uniref:hypothetical protein n=1 Tax=Streptomyces sp. NPDC002602 TaxID=3364654 RepID=UPI0036983E8C